MPRRAAAGGGQRAQAAQEDHRSIFVQLLPLLLLFGITLLSSLPSILTDIFSTPDPGYSFTSARPYTAERMTTTYNIPYFVSPNEFNNHPIYESIPESHKSSKKAGEYSAKLRSFEIGIERQYVSGLKNQCSREYDYKEARIERNRGVFGFGADWDAIKKIQAEPMPSCEKLQQMGVLR